MVGAGIGGGFENTNELHVMSYDQAMESSDKDKWKVAIEKEHENMRTNNVWKAVPIKDVGNDATILSSKWVMKRKANGVFKARLTARGFEQRDGEHYDKHDKSSPVVSDITIRIVFV
jgi:hypothetical protein